MCSNDMKSCYDQILHPIMSLCLQRMGAVESSIMCAFTSLQLLRDNVRTAYRDSENFFREECLVVDYKGQVLEKATNIFKPLGYGCG